MNNDKILTFEKWYGDFVKKRATGGYSRIQTHEEVVQDIWTAARQGMIPENEAIRIPDEKDWPNEAKYLEIHFVKESNPALGGLLPHVGYPIGTCLVHKPKPKWKPTVGEDVFVRYADLSVGVGKVEKIVSYPTIGDLIYVNSFGNISSWAYSSTSYSLKPFSPEYLCSKWEEIPSNN